MKKFLLLVLLSVSGCASVIEGSTQDIVIKTDPPGAMCTLERRGLTIGSVARTPGTILVDKTKYDIRIICDKEGYQTATYFNRSSSAAATFGNIVAGGLVGWGIDSARGADNKYDSPVTITLIPQGVMAQ